MDFPGVCILIHFDISGRRMGNRYSNDIPVISGNHFRVKDLSQGTGVMEGQWGNINQRSYGTMPSVAVKRTENETWRLGIYHLALTKNGPTKKGRT